MALNFFLVGMRKRSLAILSFALLQCLFTPIYSQFDADKLEPVTVIKGKQSKLNRPEGLAFSPSGDCLAVANSEGSSITIHKRSEKEGAFFETVPCCILQDPNLLYYAHDVKFTPCGQYLAVACRETSKVVFFKRSDENECVFHKEPYLILERSLSKLNNPASLSFSPCGRMLAVCNRMGGSGITFYQRSENDNGKFEPAPFHEISEEQLLGYGLTAPHGIDFAQDGASFAVVHKKYFKNSNVVGQSSLAIYKVTQENDPTFSPYPAKIIYCDDGSLHSVSFYPSSPFLAIAEEQKGLIIYQNDPLVNACVPIANIDVSMYTQKHAAVKGCAFSPDGQFLGVTTEEPSVLIYPAQKIINP